MKQVSTLFLKTTLVAMALIGLAVCIFAIPSVSKSVGVEWSQLAYMEYPILIGGYLTVIPFFIALYQAFRLLNAIDKNTAFSSVSVRALKTIKHCGVVMTLLYAAGMPFIFQIADADDAPGLVILWALVVAAPTVIAVFAAVLQKVLQYAIDIKSENDLVV